MTIKQNQSIILGLGFYGFIFEPIEQKDEPDTGPPICLIDKSHKAPHGSFQTVVHRSWWLQFEIWTDSVFCSSHESVIPICAITAGKCTFTRLKFHFVVMIHRAEPLSFWHHCGVISWVSTVKILATQPSYLNLFWWNALSPNKFVQGVSGTWLCKTGK